MVKEKNGIMVIEDRIESNCGIKKLSMEKCYICEQCVFFT